jgi:pyruvate/2-oxoglutarate dehydrogenase complex dihydrolipoamide dehydrogenase (E3) component
MSVLEMATGMLRRGTEAKSTECEICLAGLLRIARTIEEGRVESWVLHLLGPEADELINVFAWAIQSGATMDTLLQAICAYLTHGSNVTYML